MSRCAAALLLVVLAGCGRGEAATPQDVTVLVGGERVAVHPTQYCQDGAPGMRGGGVLIT